MNIKKYLLVISFFLILITLSTVFFVHKRIWGFREAMEQLVTTGTNGQYKLEIKGYSVGFTPFVVTFDSLQIIKTDTSSANVRRVAVDHIFLRTGSLIDFLKNSQFEIDTLLIEEPIIELTPVGKPKSKGVHFFQQVVKLYPAVLAILERFNVKHFEIQKAALDIKNKKKTDLQLSLIDLLIAHWNIKNLSDDRQLLLAMGAQKVTLSKGAFNFSGLGYDFQKRELRFSDFHYSSFDSLGNTLINATGDYIAFKHLDYQELFHHQRLAYERIIFQSPSIRARLHRTSKKVKKNTQQIISDFVASTVGEFSLDSATVTNGSFQLTVLSDHDSIEIDIPDVTINTNKIRILPNEPIHIGDIDLRMKQSHARLKNGLSVAVDDFLLGFDKNLIMKNLQLYDYHNNRKIAIVPFVEFTPVDLLRVIEERKLELAAIKLNDAQLWIDASNTNPSKTSDKPIKYPEISIEQLDFRNLSLTYQGLNEQVFADGVSVKVNNISSNPSSDFQFSIQKFSVKQAKVEIPTKQVTFQGTGIVLDGQSVSANQLNLTKSNLTILANDLLAVHGCKIVDPRSIDHLQWKSIRLQNLEISGTPELTAQNQHAGFNFPLAVEKVEIPRILVALHRGDTTLTGSIADLLIRQVSHSVEQPLIFSELSATSRNLQLKTGILNANISSLSIHWPKYIQAHDLKYSGGGKEFELGNFQVENIAKEAGKWSSTAVTLRAIHYAQAGVLANLDSVRVDSLSWYNQKPRASVVEVYRPEIQLTNSDQQKSKPRNKEGQSLSELVPDQFVVHPGKVELADGNTILFGTILGNLQEKRMAIQSVEYHMPKNMINVSHVVINSNEVQVDTLSIIPIESWYVQNNLEAAKLHMKISHMKLPNQIFDSLLFKRKFYPAVLTVSNFDLFATKDKRLPDPPEVEKPWSLSSLIKHPIPLPIQAVHIHDGNIRVEEISDKTGQSGKVEISDVRTKIDLKPNYDFMDISVDATARLYNQGKLQLNYHTLNPDSFKLQVRLNDFDLRLLNEMITPTLSMKIKSGTVDRYFAEAVATNDRAEGAAGITYKDLHIEIEKRGESRRNTFLSAISDKLFLTNSKKWVISEFEAERIKHKSVFAYWIHLSSKGAIDVIVNGQ